VEINNRSLILFLIRTKNINVYGPTSVMMYLKRHLNFEALCPITCARTRPVLPILERLESISKVKIKTHRWGNWEEKEKLWGELEESRGWHNMLRCAISGNLQCEADRHKQLRAYLSRDINQPQDGMGQHTRCCIGRVMLYGIFANGELPIPARMMTSDHPAFISHTSTTFDASSLP